MMASRCSSPIPARMQRRMEMRAVQPSRRRPPRRRASRAATSPVKIPGCSFAFSNLQPASSWRRTNQPTALDRARTLGKAMGDRKRSIPEGSASTIAGRTSDQIEDRGAMSSRREEQVATGRTCGRHLSVNATTPEGRCPAPTSALAELWPTNIGAWHDAMRWSRWDVHARQAGGGCWLSRTSGVWTLCPDVRSSFAVGSQLDARTNGPGTRTKWNSYDFASQMMIGARAADKGTAPSRRYSLPLRRAGRDRIKRAGSQLLKKLFGGRCHFPLVVEKKYRLRLLLKAAHHEIRIDQEVTYRMILLAIDHLGEMLFLDHALDRPKINDAHLVV